MAEKIEDVVQEFKTYIKHARWTMEKDDFTTIYIGETDVSLIIIQQHTNSPNVNHVTIPKRLARPPYGQ